MTISVPRPEVLRAGIEHIQQYLEFWNQGSYVYYWDNEGWEVSISNAGSGTPPCGTTACLAGHILLSQGETWENLISEGFIADRALDYLGFDRNKPLGARGEFVSNVFYLVYDENGSMFGGAQERFDKFKAYVSEVTGVEL